LINLESAAYVQTPVTATFNKLFETMPCFVNFIVPPATMVYSDTISGVAPLTNSNIISVTATAETPELFGIQASGSTDATYILSINGTNVFRFLVNVVNPNVKYDISPPVKLNTGDVLLIYVENNSTIYTGQYTATILGNLT